MSQRFFSPNQQFYNDTGTPYANGKLYFYASTSSTPQDTYSNSTLTIANTNPVILDSAGRAGSVFLANSAYKVTLTDENDVLVWTEDPVWSSDYSTVAMFTVHTGTPNGTVAGTAGTQGGRPSDTVWDNVNNILYVATTSGNASTTVWTAVNPSSSAGAIVPPTGRLTPTSGTPVITTDATAQTAIYYTPYTGTTVPIYTGSTFTQQTFAELTLTLVSAHALNTLYDIFVFNDSGVVTLVTGPAWTSSAAGSSTRGTGAGTTQISRISGLWVNTVSMTGRNSSTTYSVSANAATYLGTIFIDGTAGQVSCYVSVGQNRKFGVWNAYNRKSINLQVADNTVSWSYTTATIRQSNAAAGNKATVMCGLQEELINGNFLQLVNVGGTNTLNLIGFGIDSTTAFTGKLGTAAANAAAQTTYIGSHAYYSSTVLGISNWNLCESGAAGSTFNGTNNFMVASVQWQG